MSSCSKTPEDHARIASDPGVRFEKSMSSVQALAATNDQMRLAGVAAASRNPDIRRAAVDKLDDPQAMAAFAKKVREADVADLATEVMGKIADRRLLADIATNADSVLVRIEAAALLDDQTTLANIAKDTRSPDILRKVIERLSDQAALVSIAKANATQQRVWGPALDKLDDQTLLAALARDAIRHQALSAKAAGKLRDQTVLEEIAQSALPDDVRKAAIASVTNQRALADIAGNDPDTSIRLAAINKLTNQQTLTDIANSKDGDENLQSAALRKITDPQLLVSVAKNADSLTLRWAAVERLDDQHLLTSIARSIDYDESTREKAVKQLTDQQVLASFALKDDSDVIRFAAIGRLTDQQALADIAKNDDDSAIAFAALEQLNDQRLLAETAADSEHGQIRSGALERIKDSQALDRLARNEGATPNTRLLALWRLADKPLLSALAENAPDERVRRAAAGKLSANGSQTIERGKLEDLINEGKLLAEINGDSIRNLRITLRKLAPHPLEVTIPAGTYFVCDNAGAQNMVSTAAVTLTLRGDTQNTGVPVACANKPKAIPGKHDSFTLGVVPNAGELEKLMAVLGRKNISFYTKQAAVWIITDNADYDGLDSLRTVGQYTPIIPGIAPGTRSIEEPEAAEAMQLCDEAGIDIKAKSIWRDCQKILAGLKAGELRNWLKAFSGLVVPAHKETVTALSITRNGKLLASGDDSGEVKLWNLPDGSFISALTAHVDNVDCLAISPDGKWLVTRGNEDCYLKLWHMPDGKLVREESIKPQEADEHSISARINAAVFCNDGKWFVTADDDGFIKLWSLPGGKLLKTLVRQVASKDRRPLSIDVLALSPDGTLLATNGESNEGERNIIKLWSLPEGNLVRTLEGHSRFLRFISISSDGKQLVSGDEDRVVNVWSLPDGALLKTMKEIDTSSATVSPDGKYFVATEPPKNTRRGGLPLSEFRASLWRLPDGEVITRLEGLTLATFSCSAITPDSTQLVTGDRNGNVQLRSLPDGKLIKTLSPD